MPLATVFFFFYSLLPPNVIKKIVTQFTGFTRGHEDASFQEIPSCIQGEGEAALCYCTESGVSLVLRFFPTSKVFPAEYVELRFI